MAPDAPPLVLVNPRASRIGDAARRQRLVGDVAAAVRTRTGAEPEIVIPDGPTEARASLLGAAEPPMRSLVVVAGGDGTVREATHDLAGSAVSLGIVPLGTANLFAASVGVPLDARQAIDAIASGGVRSVDLGRARWSAHDGGVGEGPFAVACGTGFDARLMASTSATAKRRLGRYGYFATALRMLGDVRGFEARIDVDGDRRTLEAIAILVANSGQLVPGLLRPALPIRVEDGLLDIFVVAAGGLVGAAIGGLEAVARRSLGPSTTGRSVRLRGAHIRIETEPAEPIEVDGDVVGSGWLEASSVPSALRVIVGQRRRGQASARRARHDTSR
jgi:diacylglycerol kinase family enzyme